MIGLFTAALVAAWSGAALAGTLYVNGVRADGLRGFEFKSVTVRIDERGDVWVDAPQYRVEIDDPGSKGAADTTRTTTPTTAAGAATGHYWLVSEDNGSVGHVVDVVVNGTLVQRIRSGDAQIILDLGPYLRQGGNTVTLSTTAAGAGGGGPLNVYLGTGSNRSGTVVLDNLEVTYTRRAQDAVRPDSRTFQLVVP